MQGLGDEGFGDIDVDAGTSASAGAPPSDAPALPHGYPPHTEGVHHGPSAVHLPGIIRECQKALADHCAAKGIDVALLPLDIAR
eukprot:gene9205-8972_t